MNWIMVLLLSLQTTSEIYAIEFAIKYSNPNKEIILPCHYNEKADRIRWYFKRNEKNVWVIIFDLRMNTQEGFEGIYNLKQNYCNLKIFEATRGTAGSYYFEHGIEQMKVACKYKVVVGDLKCDSNMRENKILVGENDCPIKAESFRRSCTFSYYGNFDGQINFNWMNKYSGNTIVKHKTLQHNISSSNELSETLKIVAVEDAVQVSNDMDKTIFECHLEHTDIEPCQLPLISIQYAKNISKGDPPMYSNNLNNKSCLIDKADSVECSYYWDIQNENVTFQTNGQHLTQKHLTIFGQYQCISTCRFISNEVCQLLGTSFHVYEYSNLVSATWKIISIVQFISIIFIIIFGMRFYVIAKNMRSKNVSTANKCRQWSEKDLEFVKQLPKQGVAVLTMLTHRITTPVNVKLWKNKVKEYLTEIQLNNSKLNNKRDDGETFYILKLEIAAFSKPLEGEENRNNFGIDGFSMSERGESGGVIGGSDVRGRGSISGGEVSGSKRVAFSSSESVIGGRGRSSGFGGGASDSTMVVNISGSGLMGGSRFKMGGVFGVDGSYESFNTSSL